ncbi:glycine zipper family protein [Zoogloea sp.]|uniref:glycine zipper family protein n=1 Tax=Zoogloea sp. TaxID=49181 RepID=UPI0035AF49F7
MKIARTALLAALPLVVLAGCAVAPTGPTAMVLPGTGKNFDQFRSDDMDCRQYAQYQIGGRTADQAAVDAGVRSAAIGTVVGAAAGAAMGGHNGAGVGAGAGLLFGSAAGSGAAQSSAYGSQRQYDNAYIQCMYAKGHQVPVPQGQLPVRQAPGYSTPSSAYPPPPPPPGYRPPGMN